MMEKIQAFYKIPYAVERKGHGGERPIFLVGGKDKILSESIL